MADKFNPGDAIVNVVTGERTKVYRAPSAGVQIDGAPAYVLRPAPGWQFTMVSQARVEAEFELDVE